MKLKKLMTFVLFLIPIFMYGQDTIYIDKYGTTTKDKLLAMNYRILSRDSTIRNGLIEKEYYLSGKIKSEAHKMIVTNEKTQEVVWEGKFKQWYESGKLQRDIDFHEDNFNGTMTTFWENGKIKRHEHYVDGKSLEGKCYDENGSEMTYYPFRKKPEFPGGNKALLTFMSENLRYPKDAQKKGKEGNIKVPFGVDTDGQVTDIGIEQKLYPSLDEAAMKLVSKLPHFIPGEQDGEKVAMRSRIQIKFSDQTKYNN